MRILLAMALASMSACVTLEGPRQYSNERYVETHCEPGPPSAMLDPNVRDRVRLVFSQAEHCTETWEVDYVKEQRRRMSSGVRAGFATGAGLIVAVPLTALAIVAGQPQQLPRIDVNLDPTQPTQRYVASGQVLEPVVYGILFAGIGTGMLAYEAMKAADPMPPVHGVERTKKLKIHELVVRNGTVNAPALEVGGLHLSQGVLDLPLDEAQGLADGELYLDGRRVELVGDTAERLGFLPICKRALEEEGSDFTTWDTARPKAWKLADACDRRGWTFAENVRVNAIRPRR